jgi:cytochrome c-L
MKTPKLLTAALLLSIPFIANAAITFTSTADGKTLAIPAESFNSPAAKEFLSSGRNTYLGNPDAIKAGKKTFQLYSCTACHGAHGEGAVGPNLIDDKWNYPKNANDQGIFETIWGGTAGGMGAKGLGLMQPEDPTQGLTPDEILKVVAFLRSNAVGAAPVKTVEPAKLEEGTKPSEAAKTEVPAATTSTVVKPTNSTSTKKSKKTKKVKKPAKPV